MNESRELHEGYVMFSGHAWPIFVIKKNKKHVTDGRTDKRTDDPSYRDARTHLKRKEDKREEMLAAKI